MLFWWLTFLSINNSTSTNTFVQHEVFQKETIGYIFSEIHFSFSWSREDFILFR